jgi:hypothetical protein
MASGLVAYFAVIFYLQSRNQWYFVLPPIFCVDIFVGVYWGRQKKQVEGLFFCIGIIRFDLALHMMFFHIAFFLIIKNIYIWGEFAGYFFLGLSNNCMYFLLISQFFGY